MVVVTCSHDVARVVVNWSKVMIISTSRCDRASHIQCKSRGIVYIYLKAITHLFSSHIS